MRWFLRLSYRGAPFHGWQSQPNAVSVQQTLEEALATIMRRPVPLTGAGRTDTGVNAREMFSHFDTDSDIPDRRRFLIALNRLCGRDIAIHALLPVRPDAHARFDATERTYKYFVARCKTALLSDLVWQATSPLDFGLMNEACELLMRTEDFTSFAKLHSDTKTNICHLTEARWEQQTDILTGERIWVFTISADRFLRNMVRAVTGTLVDVGRGKISIGDFARIIDAHDRCAAGTSMPPQALSLWRVRYPDDIFLKE